MQDAPWNHKERRKEEVNIGLNDADMNNGFVFKQFEQLGAQSNPPDPYERNVGSV